MDILKNVKNVNHVKRKDISHVFYLYIYNKLYNICKYYVPTNRY